jgi:predicted dehydrogenase
MEQGIRVGVVGTGHWAVEAHVPGFQACPGVEVVGIVSRSRERGEEVARRHGISGVFTSAEEMIAGGGLDLVSVVTPDDCHPREARAALAAGLHVLCEKPLARTYADAEAMTAAARDAAVLTKVGFTMRYAPAMMRLKELVSEGFIGTPYLLEMFLQNGQFLSPAKPRHWKMIREHAGAGAIVEYGIHGLDLALWLLGDIARVCASGRTFIPERPLPDGTGTVQIDVDDSTVWLMDFANGAHGVAHAGWATIGRPPGFELRVYGSQGAVQVVLTDDLPGCELLRVATSDDQGFVPVEIPARLATPLPPSEPWWRRFHQNLIQHFIDEIRAGAAMEPTFADGARAQRVLGALVVSMDERRWVTV